MNEKTRMNFCPKCRSPLDAAQGVGHERKPKRGDYTICIYCGSIWQFGKNLVLDRPYRVPLAVIVARNKVLQALKEGLKA